MGEAPGIWAGEAWKAFQSELRPQGREELFLRSGRRVSGESILGGSGCPGQRSRGAGTMLLLVQTERSYCG